jgi:hypothetical protein
VQWANAIRSAEIDPDRYLRAAKQLGKDLSRTIENDPGARQMCRVLSMVNEVAEVETLSEIARLLLFLPLPLPILIEPPVSRITRITYPTKVDPGKKDIPEVSVAFVSFSLNNASFADPHTIEPYTLHDLAVEARVSRWPEGAEKLVLDVVSVEPPDIYKLPTFIFTKPDGTPPYSLREVGRMLLHVPQAFFSRPLEFSYRARFLPEDPGAQVTVEGQRHLHIQTYDPEVNPQTGFREVDFRLNTIRQEARSYSGVRDKELGSFLIALGGIGRIAGQAIQDNLFPGTWSERQFQAKVKELLRSDPKIGSELEEHPHAAGGITDLSFRKIRIELKASGETYLTIDKSLEFSNQPTQYVVGSDRRFGILCVLDHSPKRVAPGAVANDIALQPMWPPENNGAGDPILLGVVIVRGNLARPSDLSR